MPNGRSVQGKTKKIVAFEIKVTMRNVETPYATLRQTRKKHKSEIDNLIHHLTGFYFLPIQISTQTLQISLDRVKRKIELDSLSNILGYNEVMTPTIWLCKGEFNEFLSELQTAAYNGAARTLRCILEIAVEACEFQTEPDRTTYETLINEVCSIEAPKRKEKLHTLMVRYNAWASFMERYRVYEQNKRIAPTFKERINRLNSRQMFQEAPTIFDVIKETYETLSNYVHPSLARIERQMQPQLPISSRLQEFATICELSLKTLDIVQFIYVKAISHFLGYTTTKEFLKDFANMVTFPSKLATTFLKLPFTKRLSEGVNWKWEKEGKKT